MNPMMNIIKNKIMNDPQIKNYNGSVVKTKI